MMIVKQGKLTTTETRLILNKMELTAGQLQDLRDLCLALAKGLILAALAVPVITKEIELMASVRSLLLGVFFTLLALRCTRLKEVGI